MLLVDTSIWIDHFRKGNPRLSAGLLRRQVLIHAFVLGELALGRALRFGEIITDLSDLPNATIAAPAEVLQLISRVELAGSGIGYVDAHLVASTLLTPDCRLWTRDRKLRAVAERLSIAAQVE
ncbi:MULTISPECIES: PIN domain-containing protein [Rhodopseudomonas]|uniref:Ribonuclease n=1 Tax=Rhodopseudomonas palustris TaxID=1076 RepID=A0A0D7EIB9_RHOPL|nr:MULTISPECIES: PIN domain-containing protein [Rhodopseudomonas]KIZ40401.1 ribonuclease [Rhodopseudomonas palustris]MDF3810356.1 type II toxin-antitoxin system VapC family toxin [Rhodopseudomonas sp. BAL398]WOK17377.1 type II toxin-antitoxin system VapC family toxin [Rhodopseudomonas sp. BAL398]